MLEVVDMAVSTTLSLISSIEHSRLYFELSNIHIEFKLDGKNLLQSIEFFEIVLTWRGKLNHIYESVLKQVDPSFRLWKEEDVIIKTWLWSTMTAEVNANYLFLCTIQRYIGKKSIKYTQKKMKQKFS